MIPVQPIVTGLKSIISLVKFKQAKQMQSKINAPVVNIINRTLIIVIPNSIVIQDVVALNKNIFQI